MIGEKNVCIFVVCSVDEEFESDLYKYCKYIALVYVWTFIVQLNCFDLLYKSGWALVNNN